MGKKTRIRVLVLMVLAISSPIVSTGLAQEESSPAPTESTGDLARAVKGLEAKLGLHPTGSFERTSKKAAVDYRCYYTGVLQLPEFYDGLRLKRGKPHGCKVNTKKYDVFFYPLQAMGSPKSQITTSLAESSPERVLMVIPHEDFHQDPALRGLPEPLAEAAATLVGFLTARDVARQQYGSDSEVYRNLSKEAFLFQTKSGVVNRYFEQVRDLYAGYAARKISKTDAFASKARIYGALERECEAIEPNPKSFDRCLAANNNAGLSFDHTYTLYYPLMYEVAEAHGEDLKATIDALKQAMAGKSGSEAIESLRAAGASNSQKAGIEDPRLPLGSARCYAAVFWLTAYRIRDNNACLNPAFAK